MLFIIRGVRATRTEYDDDGRMVRQINPAGDTLYFDHDVDNRIETTRDFNGNETVYTYDDRGNVLSKTDEQNNTWSYEYDALDNYDRPNSHHTPCRIIHHTISGLAP